MTLSRNAAALAIMHGTGALQPLLLIPYGARVLGPTAYGQYVYIIAMAYLANTLVDYGFSWTAQRSAAAARHDPAALARLLAEITAAKGLLCVAVAAIGLITYGVLSIPLPLLLYALTVPLGGTLFAGWLFIAIERPWRAAVPLLIARGLALVLFILLVKSPADIELAVATQALIPMIAAFASLPFVVGLAAKGFASLTCRGVVSQLRNGWPSFVSTLSGNAVLMLPVPLVGHFAGFAAAGQYSVAEKLVNATRIVFRAIGETLMPRVAYLAQHDPARGIALIRRSYWTLVIGVSLSLGIYVVGPYAIELLLGPNYAGAVPLLNILCLIPIIVNIRFCASHLYMFNYGYDYAWVSLSLLGALTFLGAAYLLSYWIEGAKAVAAGVLIGECVVAAVSTGFFIVSGAARRQVRRTADV
ncbi:lipopolysaccharide biosynthesis protein [Microvirga roseola]|uniref:lipopolysaccharide biosynthesis protein n=1 Tax=Microvirga roseola TaxID=2883126 RepID=UPI0022A8148F|nr:oligosaccharide flippase family protein [Microvirga roseola]